MSQNRLEPEEILAQLGWVRALARGLMQDAHAADDVAQSACLLALERPPRKMHSLRAWLARVTRTLARQEVRAGRARAIRERASQTERHAPSTFEVYSRGQRQSRVAQAVLDLPEPYASTVLYHYLDGLSAVEVAERTGTSPAGVRKRLQRAREMLRERLDEEFGCQVDSWGIALLAIPASPFAAAGAAMGGKATVVGGVAMGGWLMGNKILWAVGLVLVAGIATFLTRGFGPPDSALGRPGLGTQDTAIAPYEQAPLEPTAEAPPARAEVAETAPAQGSGEAPSRSATGTAETVLRVRALDQGEVVVAQGIIECRWDTVANFDRGATERRIRAEVVGPVTEIVLPVDAVEALVSVSLAGRAAEPPVRLRELRRGADGEERVVHEVDVPVGTAHSGPFLSGRITVDGVSRAPEGLRIFLQGHGHCWVHVSGATYRLGPVLTPTDKLFVTSDETVPMQVSLDPGDSVRDQVVDIELASGRTLLIHALDAATGAPAPRTELHIVIHAEVERSRGTVLHQPNELRRSTDDAGTLRLRGIPLKGQVAVMQPLPDGGSRSLAQLHLKPDGEPVIEVEVHVDADPTAVVTRVFGELPALEGADARGRRVVRFRGNGSRSAPLVAEVAPDGTWSIELPSHQVWTLWAELDGTRRSDDHWLELRGEVERGPIPIGWQGAREVLLRLVDVPPTGSIQVEVRELDPPARQRFRLAAAGNDIEQPLKLSGTAAIEVTVGPEGADSELGAKYRAQVDPRQEKEVLIALGASSMTSASVRVDGGAPAGEGQLLLVDPFVDPNTRPAIVLIELEDGLSKAPQVVVPGKYIYIVRHPGYPGFVGGVFDVPVEGLGTIEIDWQGKRVPRSELGDGIRLDELEGTALDGLPEGLRRSPWSAELAQETELWIPANCVYEPYAK